MTNKSDSDEPVTRGMLNEAVDAILKGVGLMFAKQNKRIDALANGQREMKRQISDLKYDTPARKEFNEGAVHFGPSTGSP